MPILDALGKFGDIHPVHMGVCVIVTLSFGLITPPYGLSLLLASRLKVLTDCTNVLSDEI